MIKKLMSQSHCEFVINLNDPQLPQIGRHQHRQSGRIALLRQNG